MRYLLALLLCLSASSSMAATVIGQVKFTNYSTNRQAEIAALQARPTTTGTNTGDVTLGTPNGLSLAGQVLSLQAATNSVPGALTAADHTTLSTAMQGSAGLWTPVPSNLTVTGSPTYTGTYLKFDIPGVGHIVFCTLTIDANGGTTASTIGITVFSGLPYAPSVRGPLSATDETPHNLGTGLVYTNSTIYPPSWSAYGSTVYINVWYPTAS